MDAKERFVAEGVCGGYYAVVWDRERKQIIFPYLRTGASISDDQIRAVAGELNGLLAAAIEQAVSEALEEAAKMVDKLADMEEWDLDDAKDCAAALRAKAGEREGR